MRFKVQLPITLGELAELTGGVPLGNASVPLPRTFCTNSEVVQSGDCFLALEGQRLDGNRFLTRAALHGAALLIAKEPPPFPHPPTLLHRDPKEVLELLALAYYRTLSVQTVAVTGSVGKTSAVAAIHALLSQKYRTHFPVGNRNNGLGVPITMLETPKDAEVAIFEIGSNHPGEVSHLSRLLSPHLAIVTAIGRSHIGNFGSREAIIQEKLSIRDGLREGGALLLPLELGKEVDSSQSRVMTFSISNGADFFLSELKSQKTDVLFLFESANAPPLPCKMQDGGKALHNTALIALAVGRMFALSDAELQAGLLRYTPPEGRGRLLTVGSLRFLDDGYNASPESMENAFHRLAAEEPDPEHRIALLGDMHELGVFSDACHEEVGMRFASLCKGKLFLYGKYALRYACGAAKAGLQPQRITVFPMNANTDEISARMLPYMAKGDAVLIKGSYATGAQEIQNKLIAQLSR